MKKLLIIILLFITNLTQSQINSGYYIPDSMILHDTHGKYFGINQIAATCASPSGGMNSIVGSPPSYAWLQTNGYCNPASYGSNGTVCWTFIPTGNSITINSGYSSTSCANISFGPFNLFTCAPACVNQGNGLNFTVTPGQCYTWCMGYSGNGGLCSFNDFCPYYQQTTILPIELVYFAGSNQDKINVLQWKTATEIRNNYFSIETSYNTNDWIEINRINGAGNSNLPIEYKYIIKDFNKIINYYRLKQVDYDGSYKYHGIIAINNIQNIDIKIVKVLNILGQEVSSDYDGIKIVYYSDGSVIKQK